MTRHLATLRARLPRGILPGGRLYLARAPRPGHCGLVVEPGIQGSPAADRAPGGRRLHTFHSVTDPARARASRSASRATTLATPPGRSGKVIVTPAVYPRLVESLRCDIQSTGQKSHCVNTTFWPSQCYVLIRQSDSPCPYQF
jgi:hypothetical protein